MVSTRSSTFLFAAAAAIALQNGHADAAACDADSYSKVASAVQTLHANCASWAAYLASGGVWTCDSTCHDAVANLVDALPDCTFGGPYGQNYKQVVEGMVATCSGAASSTSESTTASPSSATATPNATTTSQSNNGADSTATETPAATTTDSPEPTVSENESNSSVANTADTSGSASDIETTSGGSIQVATSITALVLVVASSLMQ
jgi:cobalamin biosynthesis Mg chelatase CobN